MSEPMSAGEIEDVLSSIRRLVSEDLRPAAEAPQPVAARDKLILTPALRVVEGGFPDVDPPVPAAGGGEDAAVFAAPTSALQAVLDDITRPAGMFDAPFAGAFDPVEIAAAPTPSAPPPSIEAVVAAVGAAVTDQRARDEGDAAAEIESDWVPDGWSEPPAADQGSADHPAGAEALAAEPTDPGERIEPDAAVWAGFVSARDPGAAAAKLRDDQAEAEAVAEITASQAFAAAAAAAEPAPEPAAFAGVFDPADTAPADTAIDEEILRDLVRDIIREELQGGLGQRITRNVRKLVRSEINLALTSRDFD